MKVQSLLYDSSRKCIDDATDAVLENPKLLNEMFEIVAGKDKPVAQRASRVIYFFAEKQTILIKPYIPQLMKIFETSGNDSVRGNLIKIFSDFLLPDDEETIGELADLCFGFLERNNEREGLKIFSMEVLEKISNLYPEIKKELILLIEKQMIDCNAGFQTRGAKVLQRLKKSLGIRDNFDTLDY